MTLRIESFGRAGYAERHLHLLEVDSVAALREGALEFDGHSSVLVAWDAGSATDLERFAVCDFLIAESAASICCWGDGCEQVYVSLNARILDPDPTSTRPSAGIIATAHTKESFDEALWYLLWCSIPDDPFEASCNDMLVLTIGRPELAGRARSALTNPDAFSERVRHEAEAR